MSNGKKIKKESIGEIMDQLRTGDGVESSSGLKYDSRFFKKVPPMSKEEEAYYQKFFQDPGPNHQKGTPVKGKPGLMNL